MSNNRWNQPQKQVVRHQGWQPDKTYARVLTLPAQRCHCVASMIADGVLTPETRFVFVDYSPVILHSAAVTFKRKWGRYFRHRPELYTGDLADYQGDAGFDLLNLDTTNSLNPGLLKFLGRVRLAEGADVALNVTSAYRNNGAFREALEKTFLWGDGYDRLLDIGRQTGSRDHTDILNLCAITSAINYDFRIEDTYHYADHINAMRLYRLFDARHAPKPRLDIADADYTPLVGKPSCHSNLADLTLSQVVINAQGKGQLAYAKRRLGIAVRNAPIRGHKPRMVAAGVKANITKTLGTDNPRLPSLLSFVDSTLTPQG